MNQAILLRKLTGKQRLEQAFKLSDFVRELARKNITKDKKLHKHQELNELKKRLRYA